MPDFDTSVPPAHRGRRARPRPVWSRSWPDGPARTGPGPTGPACGRCTPAACSGERRLPSSPARPRSAGSRRCSPVPWVTPARQPEGPQSSPAPPDVPSDVPPVTTSPLPVQRLLDVPSGVPPTVVSVRPASSLSMALISARIGYRTGEPGQASEKLTCRSRLARSSSPAVKPLTS